MMTTEQFKEIIENHSVQCVFSHFCSSVKPPFMVWLGPFIINFKADNRVYSSSKYYEIELYSRTDIIGEEERLEKYLDLHDLIFEKQSQDWIDEDMVMMTTYTVYV